MRISPGSSTVSRVKSRDGGTKNDSSGTVRRPVGPAMRASAPSATSAGAVSDGWTMKHVSPPKMQWYWFSPATAKHVSPPLRAQWNSPRKYQQRGRWQRLPPSVPWLRSCGLAAAAAPSASARYASRISGLPAISESVVRAPRRTPPSAVAAMPRSSLRPCRLTTVSAARTPSRRQPRRSVPPACRRAPGAAARRTASSSDLGLT